MKNEAMWIKMAQSFNSERISFQTQKKSFIGKTIFVSHFSYEFFKSETILLIDKRNLLNFNECVLKGM